ncbi:cytochrome c oxidase assembly protein [Nocardioides conyzicola]
MAGDSPPRPPLTWSTFLSTWTPARGWLVACVLVAAVYLLTLVRRQRAHPVPRWRPPVFLTGLALLWSANASAIDGYAMAVYWMHMVQHLTLIMAVPLLLVLGHPLQVLGPVHGAPNVVTQRVLATLTHPLTGVVVYSAVIAVTHLTGFMDAMAMNPTLATVEKALYVGAGLCLFGPTVAEDAPRPAPYLLRFVALMLAMVPDTLVGIVLLQTSTDPFPMMTAMRPTWAPPALDDINTGGALMWAVGDGLMMLAAVGVMISVVASPARRTRMTGRWLDGARNAALADQVAHGGGTWIEDDDADGDAALAAYNDMLARLEETKR